MFSTSVFDGYTSRINFTHPLKHDMKHETIDLYFSFPEQLFLNFNFRIKIIFLITHIMETEFRYNLIQNTKDPPKIEIW